MTLYEPQRFDFYIDTTHLRPVIGLTITAANGTVTVPMSTQTANDIGALLVAHATVAG
ncbi:MAG: hypothetical protein WBW75_32035 [Mycobacterium sp.]|uniref:hypothetical protein n=1 Tax=Mycobacterium sp. TaxID=1785 RepID=UPI003C594044